MNKKKKHKGILSPDEIKKLLKKIYKETNGTQQIFLRHTKKHADKK